MTPVEELTAAAKQLSAAAAGADAETIAEPLNALDIAATEIGLAFSGSWLGYHSCVYYEGFRPPPAGANFSPEWGLRGDSYLSFGSRGNWFEFHPTNVTAAIYSLRLIALSQAALDVVSSPD